MDDLKQHIVSVFERPFLDLVAGAHEVHRRHHCANEIELATLLSIKTGGCAEDCGYCSQSAAHRTGLAASRLMDVERVVEAARAARDAGSGRFCMGAAWRSMKQRDMPVLTEMIRRVSELGLETCVTLGMLEDGQAEALAEAGLDYYNHNIDTSAEHYTRVVSTRCFDDRLDTLAKARGAGIRLCCGGILGMGESREDRVSFLHTLASLPSPPESVPLNMLVPVAGTPIGDAQIRGETRRIDDLEFVRTVAVARIVMPRSTIRLSAGRESMSDSTQALCFLAGANSIFTGSRLLTAANSGAERDAGLMNALGLRAARPRPRVSAVERVEA
ncbi:biotin synthase [Endobacter medicaginis]|nr:biotin synthase BioB [Endobacter medicaginis]MBB3175354.1 biotin synthase [Endobacter medicaginis]MCX5476534.1 biotin synthase BioB [Endobacter medicaginis]